VIPENLQYTREHEWVRTEDDTVVVGITDYAQDQLGDIVFVDLPDVGDQVEAGAVIGELESTKSVSDIFSPVGGEVVATNELLESTPDTVNSDAYGDGWLLKIRVNGAPEDLMDAAAYGAFVAG